MVKGGKGIKLNIVEYCWFVEINSMNFERFLIRIRVMGGAKAWSYTMNDWQSMKSGGQIKIPKSNSIYSRQMQMRFAWIRLCKSTLKVLKWIITEKLTCYMNIEWFGFVFLDAFSFVGPGEGIVISKALSSWFGESKLANVISRLTSQATGDESPRKIHP